MDNDDYLIKFDVGVPARLRISPTVPVWEGEDKFGTTSYLYLGHQDEPDRLIKFYAKSSLHEEIERANIKEHQELEITRMDDFQYWQVKKLNK